ncbi:hypothetical protein [Hydrogenophaga sp.]|uniref:hypothetical protein n=1 Tax=Hydrogenophaga sp. TaxID=1904254 RepID=UPI0019A0B082|nr:hypothetical protein [Hydrogenophaga sp.]MBD3893782.1 hypothetical protein [Hydrogenophaga sp.]
MKHSPSPVNPFVLMLDPEAVLRVIENSSKLNSLRQHICRPLDKPLIPKTHGVAQAFDATLDSQDFMDSGSNPYLRAQPALQALH